MRTQVREREGGETNGPRRGRDGKIDRDGVWEGEERRMNCWEKRKEGEERAGGGGKRENENKRWLEGGR